ncbi:hypothetical protein LguiA_014312 [Lonicera macranthoides]
MVVRLPVLQSLSIVYCDSLRYLFCSSTATSLVQLRDLEINSCEMMEVIVKDEDEVEVDRMGKLIVFSSLISIELRRLSNLKGFCLEELCFEWPLLTSVKIELCWKMGIFTIGYSNIPILDGYLYSITCKTKAGISIQLFPSQLQDNLALKEEGILTINGFLIAGDHLVAQCPSWSWNSAKWTFDLDLPIGRKFLITRNVPCLRRAASKVVVEDKNEGDDCGGDDKNIPRPRSYDVSITYNKRNKSPRLWLRGYNDDESKAILPLELVLQDIAEHHPRKLVTIERHPFFYENHVSLYPHLQPNFIKDFYHRRALQGIPSNVENYLQILLEAYASVVPTIKYRYS